MRPATVRAIPPGVLLLLLLSGCGGEAPPPLVRVTGKVLTADGKPVTAGSILFYPDAANAIRKDPPTSQLQLDGSFSMKTFPYGEGVTVGKYKATLDPALANRMGKPKYAKPDQTPWEVTVPEGGLADHKFEVQ